MGLRGVARVILVLPLAGGIVFAAVLLVQAGSLPLVLIGLPGIALAGLFLIALVKRRGIAPESGEGGALPYLSLVFGGSRPTDADMHASLDPAPPARSVPRPERPYERPR
jgi:hypothetical protein